MKNIPQKPAESFTMLGNWETQSTQLQEKFPQLTTADLKFEAGKEDDLLQRVSTRLNKNREEIINIIRKGQPDKNKV